MMLLIDLSVTFDAKMRDVDFCALDRRLDNRGPYDSITEWDVARLADVDGQELHDRFGTKGSLELESLLDGVARQ